MYKILNKIPNPVELELLKFKSKIEAVLVDQSSIKLKFLVPVPSKLLDYC